MRLTVDLLNKRCFSINLDNYRLVIRNSKELVAVNDYNSTENLVLLSNYDFLDKYYAKSTEISKDVYRYLITKLPLDMLYTTMGTKSHPNIVLNNDVLKKYLEKLSLSLYHADNGLDYIVTEKDEDIIEEIIRHNCPDYFIWQEDYIDPIEVIIDNDEDSEDHFEYKSLFYINDDVFLAERRYEEEDPAEYHQRFADKVNNYINDSVLFKFLATKYAKSNKEVITEVMDDLLTTIFVKLGYKIEKRIHIKTDTVTRYDVKLLK